MSRWPQEEAAECPESKEASVPLMALNNQRQDGSLHPEHPQLHRDKGAFDVLILWCTQGLGEKYMGCVKALFILSE